jgi:transcriptional regulator of met regulon
MQEFSLKYRAIARHIIKKNVKFIKQSHKNKEHGKCKSNITLKLWQYLKNLKTQAGCILELNNNTSNSKLCMKYYHSFTSQPYHKLNTHIKLIGVPENARIVGLVTLEV